MKKIRKIAALLVAAVMILSVGACNSTASADTYKYADKWEMPTDMQEVSITPQLYKYAEDIKFDMGPMKDAIADVLGQYQMLDWENFEGIKDVIKINPSAKEVEGMSQEMIYTLTNYVAFYDDATKKLLILPFYTTATDEQSVYIVTHELVHALVSSGHKEEGNRLEEGLVDYLAMKVVDDLGLSSSISPGYQGEQLAIQWLVAIYGEEEVIRAGVENRLYELVDSSTKPGMGQELNCALALSHNGYEPETTVNVVYDILVHLSKNEGKGEAVKDLLERDALLYSSVNVNLDKSYYKKLLK